MTSKELAKKIGVSQSTVSRALNDSPLISDDIKNYVREEAAKAGFVLNSQARSLKIHKTGTIGILFPVFFESLSKNLMFTYIYDLVQRELIKNNFDVMMVYDYGQPSEIGVLERILKSHKVDGFISLRPTLEERELTLICNNKYPFVSLYLAPEHNEIPNFFGVDEKDLGICAGRFFGKNSEPSASNVFLSITLRSDSSRKRLEGFRKGLEENGKHVDSFLECDFTMESAYNTVIANKDLFLSKRNSLFVYNDMLSLGAVQALKTLGVAIPDETQIIGVDDIPMASWVYPKLSTVRIPVKEMVSEGCLTLMEMIDGKKFPPTVNLYDSILVRRDTTRNQNC